MPSYWISWALGHSQPRRDHTRRRLREGAGGWRCEEKLADLANKTTSKSVRQSSFPPCPDAFPAPALTRAFFRGNRSESVPVSGSTELWPR